MNSKRHVCLVSVLSCIVPILFLPQPMIAEELSAEDLRLLGRRAFYKGRYVEAERYLRQSVGIFEARGAGSQTDIAVTRGDLAWFLVAKGMYGEAEQLLDSALRLLRNDSAENCKHTAILLSHLGTLYQKTGRSARAEPVFKQALKQAERCMPSYTEVVLNGLGILYGETGRLKQAQAVLERALTLIEKQFTVDAPALVLAQTLTSLAAVHQARGKLPLAEQFLVRAIRLLEDSLDGSRPALAATFLSIASEELALLHYRQGKLDEAEHEFQRSKEIEIMSGGDPARVAKLSYELAEVSTAKGKYHDARILFQQALQDGAKETAETATMLERFSHLLRIMKADDQAEEMEFRAKRIRAALAYTVTVK